MDKNSVKPLEELLDSVRDIDGFPIGKDEDILALSDPPFYTACPNPYIKQFIEEYGKQYDPKNDNYKKTPFVEDVSEGRSGSTYDVHAYHTKVPPNAIEQYISYYTNPNDIVFDGFCGSGMSGVAAQNMGRHAIIFDLSPAATFISHNYCDNVNKHEFEIIAKNFINEIKKEIGWLYHTNHVPLKKNPLITNNESIVGEINYTIWSEVLKCPYCNNEYIYWDEAVDKQKMKIKDSFLCPNCQATITKKESERCFEEEKYEGSIIKKLKQIPILINYSVNNKRYGKKPDKQDIILLRGINNQEIPYWFPTNKIPDGDKTHEFHRFGYERINQVYTKRSLWCLSVFWEKATKYPKYQNLLRFLISSYNMSHSTIMTRVIFKKNSNKPVLTSCQTGTIYISSLPVEKNIIRGFEEKLKTIMKLSIKSNSNVIISTQSITNFKNIPSNSIDYIFTDPPFGANLMYSELSFIWEAWLRVLTNNKKEAIINRSQHKRINDYTQIMTVGFKEMYRVLKPNRWITIEFHNSKASVWNSIQEAVTRAGFIISQVAVLDKQQGSFNQVTAAGAVENDLIINAYKPKEDFAEKFLISAGDGMEVDFIADQLDHLPIRPNVGRTEKMLYSKMLAHYVENGFKIRYDSANFYKLFSDNFTELDGYWFLGSQAKEYNEWKSGLSLDQIKEVLDGQQVLFVSDEKSALAWLYNLLHQPRTYSEIYTAYQQVATTTEDKIPELRDLLDNNFILEEGKHRRPVSREEREEINKNREKELDRAFNKLLKHAKEQKGKIRNIRQEALVHGFTKCYQEGRYQDILTVADRLYASTLESSGDIMDFVDIARIKTSGEKKIEDY